MTDFDLSGRQVLVVDDDRSVGMVLVGLLRQVGCQARHAMSGAQALAWLDEHPFDAMVTDLRMPEMSGLQLLAEVQRRYAGLPVVVLTAHGSVQTAVDAMKAGAADFLTKPFEREQVLFTIHKATAAPIEQIAPPRLPSDGQLIGEAASMRECASLCQRAARSQATVLICGETGSGKEVVARTIHQASPRHSGPFVAVNCAALPDTLLESELFGYEKGAFTGATARKPGRVELAQGGTLFLDEIGDTSSALQLRLLRLLQEREYQPLGATRFHQADVRFIAATHRDLESMVETGDFREDLFYRLNVLPIWVPPLRERREDIELLARSFCAKLAADNARGELRLSSEALALLREQPWPGNVRQLQSFIERLVVFCDGTLIGRPEIERELTRAPRLRRRQRAAPATPRPAVDSSAVGSSEGGSSTADSSRVDSPGVESSGADSPNAGSPGVASDALSDMPPSTEESSPLLSVRRRAAERQAVTEALARTGNNRSQAARLLGVSRRTLYKLLDDLDVP